MEDTACLSPWLHFHSGPNLLQDQHSSLDTCSAEVSPQSLKPLGGSQLACDGKAVSLFSFHPLETGLTPLKLPGS